MQRRLKGAKYPERDFKSTVKFLEMTDRRSDTSHTYKEEVSQIIYSKTPAYFLLMESLLERIVKKI